MKPLGFKNYGSIGHLSNSKLGEADRHVNHGQERICTVKTRDSKDLIIVTEKYDGSNVGIAKKEGKILALTRAGYEAHTSPYIQHEMFQKWVDYNAFKFDEILKEGERLCGEWLIQSCGIRYEITGDPIVFFDWFDSNNKRKSFHELAELDVPLVRVLHEGESVSVDSLVEELNKRTEFMRSIEPPEGMVYRVERNGVVDFLAKWVRSDFPTGKYLICDDGKSLEPTWNKINDPCKY